MHNIWPLTSTHGEVNLRLEGEDGEGEGHPGRDADTDQHGVHAVEGCQSAEHQSLAGREYEQENEIDGRLSPDGLTAGHGQEADQHHPQRDPHEPPVLDHKPEHHRLSHSTETSHSRFTF